MIRVLALAAVLAVSGTPTAAACTVEDATLTWGLKESFRSYISGTIANGEWTVADGATYETPSFGWSGGAGGVPGVVSFPGSVTFTGHGGILDTTIADPRLRFDGSDVATLLVDVSGTTQDGVPVDAQAVEFATIQLADAITPSGLTDAPAELTADGAAAFGTYEAGEELDPISATLPGGCLSADSSGTPAVLAIVGAILAAIILVAVASAVLVVVLLARRRHSPGA
jgi:hypothetical protein